MATTIDIKRTASAKWEGGAPAGSGTIATSSGAVDVSYSFSKRFGDEPGTNPEELLGAAHSACFSMALAFALTNAGSPPASIDTKATVHLTRDDSGYFIPGITLEAVGIVPGIDEATFQATAETAKKNCPLSKALAAVPITLKATLQT